MWRATLFINPFVHHMRSRHVFKFILPRVYGGGGGSTSVYGIYERIASNYLLSLLCMISCFSYWVTDTRIILINTRWAIYLCGLLENSQQQQHTKICLSCLLLKKHVFDKNLYSKEGLCSVISRLMLLCPEDLSVDKTWNSELSKSVCAMIKIVYGPRSVKRGLNTLA